MKLSKEEQNIEQKAFEYIKQHKSDIIDKYISCCPETTHPISIFMAGSPGAGKTEVSKELVIEFEKKPLRIDADELRAICPKYAGSNAHLFQRAANRGVNILYDYALKKQRCHLILDGTFAYGGAIDNIQRSLKRGRHVEVWFVHQDPILAWEFTKAREKVETRRVKKDIFIRAFLKARENIKLVKDEFGDKVILNLLVKNTNNTNGKLYINIEIDKLDALAGDGYTENTLNNLLL